MKQVLVIFGTRPEAIKMCPLVLELKERAELRCLVCVTGQHREMLHEVLAHFGISPDFECSVMKVGQGLGELTASLLRRIDEVLLEAKPDLILVHGDTATAFSGALAGFYRNIPIAHVEAGLRTYDLSAPYPEEFYRQAISLMARDHFAPTEGARENLLREGKEDSSILVTGNTAIDALRRTLQVAGDVPFGEWLGESRLLLLTAHRRENLGRPMERIFRAARQIVEEFPDVKLLYPMHPNPEIRVQARRFLSGSERILLCEPCSVGDFHRLLARAFFVLTDSGGIQEEAPSLGKPVLVLRDNTERPEGLLAGTLRLVGTEEREITRQCRRLLTDPLWYASMSEAKNPYGDGYACQRIVDFLARNR